MQNYFILIVVLPLIGFLINLLLGKMINSEKFSGWMSSLFVFIPFLNRSIHVIRIIETA